MEKGNIVEFIDRQKIVCAVVLEVKNRRLRLLTETNREINLSENRLSHKTKNCIDLSLGRDKAVNQIKEISHRRDDLICDVDIKELWEVLNTEQEWIDLATMTEFCFPDSPTFDHEAAVIRAFFQNRLYFKFNRDSFYPNSQEQVERNIAQALEAARKDKTIIKGGDWLKTIAAKSTEASETIFWDQNDSQLLEYIEIIKSAYLFETESKHYPLAKKMMDRAGVGTFDALFAILVKLGIFEENENIDLLRHDIPVEFSPRQTEYCRQILAKRDDVHRRLTTDKGRRDLTMLPLMTIDGQSTLDYDDALSIEDNGDHYRLGVHIIDVAYYVTKGDPLDLAALSRGSTIYMPDRKISMLPVPFAEDFCSLIAGKLRPAISVMVKLTLQCEIISYEVVPSLISVGRQLTYYDVNMMADDNKEIIILRKIAEKFREYRASQGSVQISLPDVNVWIDENNEISVSRINRESPARMLVAETMILANWLMAKFLAAHNIPAVFRSQAGPRDRLYKGDEGTLFQNYMQRRQLSRLLLSPKPERHSGLGLSVYTTATSPIRKYFDLIAQRQIQALHGLQEAYTPADIEHFIQVLESPMRYVFMIQNARHRYWLLKYLENRIGQKEEAMVLYMKRKNCQILMPEYMLECDLPLSGGLNLKPETRIQVTIQHVNARKDMLSVFLN
jgi:exoribonuclease-2